MKRKWKIILGVALAALIVAVVAVEALKPLTTDLLVVEKSSLAKTFKEEGVVVSEIDRPIFASYGGEVVELPVEEGDFVQEGDLLLRTDAEDLNYQLQQLQAQLQSIKGEETRSHIEPYSSKVKQQELAINQAEQDLENAEKHFARIEELYEAGAVSTSEFEEAESMMKTAANNLEQQKETLALLQKSHQPDSGASQYYAGQKRALEAQIASVRHKLNEARINAPISGTVANLAVEKGSVVGSAQPLMTLFDKGSYRIEVYVLSEDISSINEGMEVKLIQDRDGKDMEIMGIVEKIAPSAVERVSSLGLKEQRVKVTVVPGTSGDLDLRPGYALDVEFTTGKRDNVFVVPKTALFPYEDGEALWAVRDGKAELQPVEKGFENDREVVIEKGLQEGDKVVLNPQLDQLEEGKRVEDGL